MKFFFSIRKYTKNVNDKKIVVALFSSYRLGIGLFLDHFVFTCC